MGALAARAAAFLSHGGHDEALHAVGVLALSQGLQQRIELSRCQSFEAGEHLLVLGLFHVDFLVENWDGSILHGLSELSLVSGTQEALLRGA